HRNYSKESVINGTPRTGRKSLTLKSSRHGPLIKTMLLHTGYFDSQEKRPGKNPPIGLILCTAENDTVVRYTLTRSAQKVFASRYQLHLPTEEELARELKDERELIEQQKVFNDPK